MAQASVCPRRSLASRIPWRLVLGLLVSLGFLWLVFRKIDLADMLASLARVRWFLMVPALALFLASFLLRAVRWRVLLAPVAQVSYESSFKAIMVGFMGNSVFPARMGEFMRAFMLVRHEPIGFETAFATIVVERLFDGYMLLVFLLAALLLAPLGGSGGSLLRTGIVGALVLYTTVLLGVVMLHKKREATLSLLRRILGRIPGHLKVITSVERFAAGLSMFDSARVLGNVAAWTLVVWLASMVVVHPVIAAFPLGVSLPWYAPYVITPIVALGVLIPSAPGYAGPYHAACVAAVMLMAPSADPHATRAFAIVLHALNMLPIIAIGLVIVWMEGLSLRELGRSHHPPKDEGG